IRAHVSPSESVARVATVQASTALTYREADQVLALALESGVAANRSLTRPVGARPGFLSSVAELMHETVRSVVEGKSLEPATVPYVYGNRLYELRLLGATALEKFEHRGRTFNHVIRGRFETARAGIRPGSRFELVYGMRGDLAEIPVLISYQPKWWL